MNFRQFLGVLRARSLLVGTVFGAVIALVTVASLVMTPRYTATAQMLIDVKTPDPIAGQVLPAHLLTSYIATQVELMTSERVALRVVDTLGLADRSDWVNRLADEANANSSPEAIRLGLARLLLKDLKVRPSKDTNLLVVSYASHDRRSVAAVANEFVQAYTDTIVEMRIQPARQTREFFAEQSKQVREELARAQAKLSEFRRSKGIATTDEKDDVENMRLQELSAQLTAIQAARIEAGRKHEAVVGGRRTADVPEVLANPLIQSLKGQLAIAEARLRERSAVLGEAHPEIARIRQEVESLTQRLGVETANITGSLERNFQVNSAREAEIRGALERQRAIVLANKTAREQLAVMQKDVDAAQRAYDALITRVSQASLESRATQANVALVSTATTPLLPSSPNIPLNLSIGVVFGALLGVISALLAESLNSRVRFAEDLERVTGSPVVGELSAVPTHVIGQIPQPRLTAARANLAKLGVTSVARAEPAIATTPPATTRPPPSPTSRRSTRRMRRRCPARCLTPACCRLRKSRRSLRSPRSRERASVRWSFRAARSRPSS
ncbi:MAG: chain length determinant protein EpsF [Burkholderiaceae bacterium]|nr:chain length determinant protein EpsF [Burkholderiaceae bacterium]